MCERIWYKVYKAIVKVMHKEMSIEIQVYIDEGRWVLGYTVSNLGILVSCQNTTLLNSGGSILQEPTTIRS